MTESGRRRNVAHRSRAAHGVGAELGPAATGESSQAVAAPVLAALLALRCGADSRAHRVPLIAQPTRLQGCSKAGRVVSRL